MLLLLFVVVVAEAMISNQCPSGLRFRKLPVIVEIIIVNMSSHVVQERPKMMRNCSLESMNRECYSCTVSYYTKSDRICVRKKNC